VDRKVGTDFKCEQVEGKKMGREGEQDDRSTLGALSSFSLTHRSLPPHKKDLGISNSTDTDIIIAIIVSIIAARLYIHLFYG